MKIRTKVRAGRDCGGPGTDIWSDIRWSSRPGLGLVTAAGPISGVGCTLTIACVLHARVHQQQAEELDMKIRTKVRAGRDCGGGGGLPKDPGPIVIWSGRGDHRG